MFFVPENFQPKFWNLKKEKLCYVAEDLILEENKDSSVYETTYTMPDGQVINLGRERFLCPESLFEARIY